MANATKLNKLKDRCKIKRKTGDKMSSSTRGFELRVLSGLPSSQPPRYTTVPFSFMLLIESILTLLNLSGESYGDLLIALFFLPEQLFLCTKECLTIFKYLEINWDGLQADTNDFLRFTTVL